MNNFMPSNLTSALYNQVNQNKGEQYSYDINLSSVNKSLNEYNMGQALYDGDARRQKLEAVIIEADEESYYQNDSPVRGIGGAPANRRMT
jgi:hypothetical protein